MFNNLVISKIHHAKKNIWCDRKDLRSPSIRLWLRKWLRKRNVAVRQIVTWFSSLDSCRKAA